MMKINVDDYFLRVKSLEALMPYKCPHITSPHDPDRSVVYMLAFYSFPVSLSKVNSYNVNVKCWISPGLIFFSIFTLDW